ncbi:MAG: ATP-grasp ribosomal peptide maturase, partial [Gammaproteobacteria bacterium]
AEVPANRHSDPSIAATAHLFQAKIDRGYDVRLTVVRGQLFAASLRRRSDDGLDWRRSHRKISY